MAEWASPNQDKAIKEIRKKKEHQTRLKRHGLTLQCLILTKRSGCVRLTGYIEPRGLLKSYWTPGNAPETRIFGSFSQ